MTDFSKIKTIDELDFQTRRMERRASIQRERIDGHVDFCVREYHHIVNTIDAVVAPIRNTIGEYRRTLRVIIRIVRALFGKK